MRLFLLSFYLFLLAPHWEAQPLFLQKLSPEGNTIPQMESSSLFVFLDYDQDQHFIRTTLPQLKTFAETNGIRLEERNAQLGLPALITSTPAIILQNHRGRSWYAGRYASFSTIQNFIRTSRRIPQQLAKNCRQEILASKVGRTQIATPLKITRLAGQLPQGFSEEAFQAAAKQAILAGTKRLALQKEVCLEKTDRTFYLDFHPYRNEQGEFFLSAEVYSQFSCIAPIWSNFGQVAGSSYENFADAFSDLAKDMEDYIWQQLAVAENGDAITFVNDDVPIKTWEELNMALPPTPEEQANKPLPTFAWTTQWTNIKAVDEFTPLVQFRFPEPLERYAGEVTQLEGDLQLDENRALQSGIFKVSTKSLTMGIADFDAKVHKDYIKVKKFPQASFSFGPLQNSPSLKAGETTSMTVSGIFELMKIKQAIEVKAQITPILDEAGQPVLQVEASFSINITDDFKIQGPDGPSPARKTLLFNLNFLLNAK